MSETPTDNWTVVKMAPELTSPLESFDLKDGIPVVCLHKDAGLHSLEPYLERPVRKRAVVVLNDRLSFLAYVKEHLEANSRAFAQVTRAQFEVECIFDYHGPAPEHVADWGQHRCKLAMPFSEEFLEWRQFNGKKMGQQEFGEFIEEHISVFRNPDAATMLEVVREFRATRKAEFSSDVNEINGDNSFSYTVETKATAAPTRGQMEVPAMFTIELPIFKGEPAEAVDAFLRYRVDETGLTFHFKFVQLQQLLDDAASRLLNVLTDEGDMVMFNGSVSSMA